MDWWSNCMLYRTHLSHSWWIFLDEISTSFKNHSAPRKIKKISIFLQKCQSNLCPPQKIILKKLRIILLPISLIAPSFIIHKHMCVLASDSMSEDFFFHKHNNHCETCVNIHSHILAQPNLADNAERFVTVITKSQQYFYTRLSRCHFSFTITLNVLNTNKYIQL